MVSSHQQRLRGDGLQGMQVMRALAVAVTIVLMCWAGGAAACYEGDVKVQSKSLGIIQRLIVHNDCGCEVAMIAGYCNLSEQRLADPEVVEIIGDHRCMLYQHKRLPPHSVTNNFYGGDDIQFQVTSFQPFC